MSSYNYSESPNLNLVCCICRSPFVEPCTTRTCCHTFCYECIAQAITINSQCPIDRTHLTMQDLMPADPVIRNMVDELMVHCSQEALGCSHTCQRLLLPIHLKDACQYVHLPCPDSHCQEIILHKDVEQHNTPDLLSIQSATHPDASQSSAQDTTAQQVKPTSDSSSSGTSTSSPAPDLAAENAILRLRLSALENVVHTLRSEMFAVKHALGPWYRPDLEPHLEPDDQSEDVEASSTAFERQLAEELSPQAGGAVIEMPSSPVPRHDPTDISFYFPPVEESVLQGPSQQRRHRSTSSVGRTYVAPSSTAQAPGSISPMRTPHSATYPNAGASTIHNPVGYSTPVQTPGTSYRQGVSLAANAAATIPIAPLDPSQPLPDTLAALHSSLVTTAGALGAIAAARSVEALRTGEEMRGLRTAVHGLRMQLHDILTSRTYQADGTPGGSNPTDGAEPNFGLVPPGSGWLGYALRPFGMPMHPPPFGISPVPPPPTNITKL